MSIPYTRAYAWRQRGNKPDVPGIQIANPGRGYTFIPWEYAATIADQIIDLHEKYEEQQQ